MPDLEDVAAMALPELSHRVVVNLQAEAEGVSAESLIAPLAKASRLLERRHLGEGSSSTSRWPGRHESTARSAAPFCSQLGACLVSVPGAIFESARRSATSTDVYGDIAAIPPTNCSALEWS
jgi:hypothetical protein